MTQASREQRRDKVIEVLNTAREMELHAIYQYMNQHYGLDDMDYGELAKNIKLVAIDEMRHAEQFAERIKELGGEPVAASAQEVHKGQKVDQIFTHDSGLEENTIDAYNRFLQVCRDNGDSITAKLFEQIIDEEQEHLSYFENVDNHIQELGTTYLARIAGTPASTGGFSKGFVLASDAE
ncbi:ferritin-like domain-containing protein [Desulfoplanes formicivorans]|uniref:Bacterioferritin n=1 Tax=Desulfoplanes formicivorans TaxID=1592317 RepID=A0A194AK42_9BACT|nr:ferritin-like domain-containing protein [Desulfoplanes formicivorans]GAU09426.1 bacterioferritin [Desulfoplanes formicivorans]